MKTKPLPTQERLKELFNYDPETGVFVRISTGQSSIIKLYPHIYVDGVMYGAHRLAWMYVYGKDPGKSLVDHIDGNAGNNRIENLRLASSQENSRNRKVGKGFYFDKSKQRWQAQIFIDAKKKSLGHFDCPLLARLAYEDARKKYFGEFSPA